MEKPSEVDQDFTDEQIANRRDSGLRALLKTPPKPHAELKGKIVTLKGKTAKKTPDK
jgi:hypothetical protein